jgi:pyridoxal 5'-phosphate synthase pdxT subunit
MRVGVLALQGDVREHVAALTRLGATAERVRRPAELDDVDALVLPGGESTTIDKLLRAFGLFEPLRDRLANGMPALGSCAGMILLARDIVGGIDGQQTLGAIPMTVRRNAFGRQIDSSEAEVTWVPDRTIMSATFIRAPWVEAIDAEVEVLATVESATTEDRIVAVRYESVIATAFHPEIAGDDRVHRLLLDTMV